ncbi:hypothetical protein LNV33_23785, partial [Klebsiella pneumoniae]|nr:hypothetical protein [Klebsiella pneumoniae]
MSQKLKVVTIGGGSSYTPELLEGFLKRYHELPVSELWLGNDSNLLIVFYVQIMPDDFVMQLHR